MLGRTIAVIVAAIGTSVAGTASAATTTTYQTGDITLTCLFPLLGNQPVAYKMQFDAPDKVSAGDVITPAAAKATASMGPALVNAFHNWGYSGIQGAANVPVTAVGLSPTSAVLSGLRIPTQPYFAPPPEPFFTIDDVGAALPAFTVTGAPGTQAELRVSATSGAPVTLPVEFVKTMGGVTRWEFKCTIKSGAPDFSPKITIKP